MYNEQERQEILKNLSDKIKAAQKVKPLANDNPFAKFVN